MHIPSHPLDPRPTDKILKPISMTADDVIDFVGGIPI